MFDLDIYLKRTQEGAENRLRIRESLEEGNRLQFHLNELAQGKHDKTLHSLQSKASRAHTRRVHCGRPVSPRLLKSHTAHCLLLTLRTTDPPYQQQQQDKLSPSALFTPPQAWGSRGLILPCPYGEARRKAFVMLCKKPEAFTLWHSTAGQLSVPLVQLSSTAWSLVTPSCSRNVAKHGALGPFGRRKGPAGAVQGHSCHLVI